VESLSVVPTPLSSPARALSFSTPLGPTRGALNAVAFILLPHTTNCPAERSSTAYLPIRLVGAVPFLARHGISHDDESLGLRGSTPRNKQLSS